MLTFDIRTDCNGDLEIAVMCPNIQRNRGIVTDCGQVTIATLHLSMDETKALTDAIALERMG